MFWAGYMSTSHEAHEPLTGFDECRRIQSRCIGRDISLISEALNTLLSGTTLKKLTRIDVYLWNVVNL
jgi:hypothetical protein